MSVVVMIVPWGCDGDDIDTFIVADWMGRVVIDW